MNFLELLKERKKEAPQAIALRPHFPLDSFISLILIFGKGNNTSDAHWTVPYWLFEYLKPLEPDPDIKEREINVFEGNGLTKSLARLSGIPESIIIDTVRRLE